MGLLSLATVAMLSIRAFGALAQDVSVQNTDHIAARSADFNTTGG